MSTKTGEAADRERRTLAGGGTPGNDLLLDDQPRGVDEEGLMQGGTHGGPSTPHRIEGQDPPDAPLEWRGAESPSVNAAAPPAPEASPEATGVRKLDPDRLRAGARRFAVGLGWFSLALGATEIAAARPIARTLGIDPRVVRAFGVREIASGFGLLAQRRKGPWPWARVLGDVLDIATAGYAWSSNRRGKRRNDALTLAALVPVLAADVLCRERLGTSV